MPPGPSCLSAAPHSCEWAGELRDSIQSLLPWSQLEALLGNSRTFFFPQAELVRMESRNSNNKRHKEQSPRLKSQPQFCRDSMFASKRSHLQASASWSAEWGDHSMKRQTPPPDTSTQAVPRILESGVPIWPPPTHTHHPTSHRQKQTWSRRSPGTGGQWPSRAEEELPRRRPGSGQDRQHPIMRHPAAVPRAR